MSNKSKFMAEMEAIANDTAFGEFQEQTMVSTGFMNLDYLNGNTEAVQKGTDVIANLGVDAGKMITLIGKPGTGKSTLAVQMAHNIVKPYDDGMVFILDFEQAHTFNRIKSVTGMSDEEVRQRVNVRHTGISTETVLELAVQVKDTKLKYKKELLVPDPNGKIDYITGEVAQVLPPTVIIVDSAAMMRPRADLDKEEMAGQMDATQAAKANKQLMVRLMQPTRDANIIVIFINHIQAKVNTGPFQTKGDLQYLKQDEMLAGGIALQHMSNTLIKLEAGTKLHPDKTYQIKGSETKVELIKSRTAEAGTFTTMIFNQARGFDDVLSIVHYLSAEGYRKGSPVGYYLGGLEGTEDLIDYKFRLANIHEVMEQKPDFKAKFYEFANKVFKKSLKITEYGDNPVEEFSQEELDEIDALDEENATLEFSEETGELKA